MPVVGRLSTTNQLHARCGCCGGHRNNDIYGEHSYPPVDGTNVWPILLNPHAYPDVGAAHPNGLVLSKEVIIKGRCVFCFLLISCVLFTRRSINVPTSFHPLCPPAVAMMIPAALLRRRYKLVVSQPHYKTNNNGWKQPDGQWRDPVLGEIFACMQQDLQCVLLCE
jgi:hypothetical protein